MMYGVFYVIFIAAFVYGLFSLLSLLLKKIRRARKIGSNKLNDTECMTEYKYQYKNIKDE